MKKVKGQPITGSKPAMNAKDPVLTDAKETSLDAQKRILMPPAPFSNPNSMAQSAPGGVMRPPAKTGMRAPMIPSGGPVGQSRMPNQSGQVFGRMGTSHPKHKGSQNLGKARKHASFYGE